MLSSRTIRLFVSSTFSDMKAERDILQDGVYPRLQDQLESLKSELKDHLGGETNFHDYRVPWRGVAGFIAADLEYFAASVFEYPINKI